MKLFPGIISKESANTCWLWIVKLLHGMTVYHSFYNFQVFITENTKLQIYVKNMFLVPTVGNQHRI